MLALARPESNLVLKLKNMVKLGNKRMMLIGYMCTSGYTPAVSGRSNNRKHFLRS